MRAALSGRPFFLQFCDLDGGIAGKDAVGI